MDIVLIGSGNVAAVLGRKFRAAGHTILQIISRNASTASALAYEWDTESANYISVLNRNADVYIIAVSDNAINEVIKDMVLPGKVVAHTAASVPMEILKEVSAHYGVLYPLQSLRSNMKSLPDIPIYFDGNDNVSNKKLKQLADTISFSSPVEANDAQRMKLHLAAVVVSNFVNHLYVIAEEYCQHEGIDFKQLLPLINETSQRLAELSASKTQTGPAVRNDHETLLKHLAMLEKYPELTKIYQLFSDSIQHHHA